MIKLDININSTFIVSDKEKHDKKVSNSLETIANLVPNHKSENFKNNLWKVFKQTMWEQQGHKCAFCEKELVSSDDAQVEHFRPKTEIRDEENHIITREAYWWLAYDDKNFLVSCSTCNKLKGNRFPLKNEEARITAVSIESTIPLTNGGNLGDEVPYIINPRYKDPQPYIAYNYRPDIKVVLSVTKDNEGFGEKTIKILDLNRRIKNEEIMKDFLPIKRGSVLFQFKKELKNYIKIKNKLDGFRATSTNLNNNKDLKSLIDNTNSELDKKKDTITKLFLSKESQFCGMCMFWLKNDTELEDDF